MYVSCNPKPLGTEFKCFVDALLNSMLYIEIQEGKVRMSKKDHFSELGATASCVLWAIDAGKKFTAFNNTLYAVPISHVVAQRKDAQDNNNSNGSLDNLNAKSVSLLEDFEKHSTPETTVSEKDNEGEKLSPKVNCNKCVMLILAEDGINPLPYCLLAVPYTFLGDSWFGSVKSAEAVALKGYHAIFVVKTAFGRTPKNWIEEEMKDYPSGIWIVLERTTSQGVT